MSERELAARRGSFGALALACLAVSANALNGGEFRMGRIAGADPPASIKVTITAGAQGEALDEPVDLHLGFGFPLRLYPLGGAAREPAFAAYAQKSSLPAGVHALQPGQSATFEFSAAPPDPNDADVLLTTPELLRDLRVRDVQRIGFASPGKSAWVLADYQIEINGRLFASHRNLNADCAALRRAIQAELQTSSVDYEFAAQEAADLAAIEASGLASDAEAARSRALRTSLGESSERLTAAALRAGGALPWYSESHEAFQPADIRGAKIRTLEVGLTTQDGGKTGSHNPMYLWADGHKYLLTSEVDPLADGRQVQTFEISSADLEANPLTRRRLTEIGIGMIGNDEPQGREPDRAKLRRVTVVADGVPLYDSRKTADDHATLMKLAFIPAAHRDDSNRIRKNDVTAEETTLWRSQALLPEGSGPLEEDPEDVPAEPSVLNDVPPADSSTPPLIVYWDGDDDQPSTPRRRKRKRRPGTPVTTIFLPTPAPAGSARPRPITSQPGPKAPVLTNIRINPAVPILRDGDQATVTWQVSGDTSKVNRYRVDLFGVLPHKAVPLIGTPLSTQRGIAPLAAPSRGGSRTLQARPPAIRVSAIRSQLSGAEASYLYVQPKVTALKADGTVLVSGFGSILPLFPAGYTSPPAAVVLPGALILPGGFASRTPPPSFQILPAAGAPGAWTTSTTADPAARSTAWTLPGEQDVIPALTFASYVASPPAVALPAYGAAVRPANNGERIAVQYEGVLPLPGSLPSPTRGWRVVGHVCFLGGKTPATAFVQSRVNLSVRPPAPSTYFTMQTPVPMTYAKYSRGTTPAPALLIDMPLRFDLMASGNTAGSNHDASKYSITSFVPAGANGFQGTAAGGRAFVSVTLMIGLQATDPTDAVGVFGLRLVPDNN